MIIILKTTFTLDFDGEPSGRAVSIYITDGTDAYTYDVGGLPLTGDLQTVLNGMEAALWPEAQANGAVATPKDRAKAETEMYMVANPNARLLFTTTASDLKSQIDALVEAFAPAGTTTGNKNKAKWLWNLVALVARESVAGE